MAYHYKIYGKANSDGNSQRISAQNNMDLSVYVGNSKNNSYNAVNIEVQRTSTATGNHEFFILINGKLTKTILFNVKDKTFSEIVEN